LAFVAGCSAPTGGPSYCDVAPIIETYCLRCHGEPQENQAPFPLVSYASTQASYAGEAIYKRMGNAIDSEFMPPTDLSLSPPVQALPAQERALVQEWVVRGAPSGGCK
jgi:hypothetical protein